MIVTRELKKVYDGRAVVDCLSLHAREGEILGFLGPNGAGKSTTVKLLLGMIPPDSGTATVDGYDVQSHPIEVRRLIGYVPEHGVVYDAFTAREYLRFAGQLHMMEGHDLRTRIADLLDLLGLSTAADERMAGYSKGMKQGVILASALLHNPRILMLDEPLSGLDANLARVVKEIIRRFVVDGRTVFFCSHNLEVVERLCSRIMIIEKGKLIAEGTAQEISAVQGASSLEQAFGALTGAVDAEKVAADVLAAIQD